MADVRMSIEIVEDLVFGFAPNPVHIVGARTDWARREIVFEIRGQDVPVMPVEVHAVVTVQSNRAGQRFQTMTFEPDADWVRNLARRG
jgi:hypothetical protein